MCDVHNLIDAALSIAKYYKRTKGRLIEKQVPAGLPAVIGVRDQLVQVFLNLILNAIDATDHDRVVLPVSEVAGDHGPAIGRRLERAHLVAGDHEVEMRQEPEAIEGERRDLTGVVRPQRHVASRRACAGHGHCVSLLLACMDHRRDCARAAISHQRGMLQPSANEPRTRKNSGQG